MKRQKYMALEDEFPRLVGVQYAIGNGREIVPERIKRVDQSRNNAQLWICVVVKLNPNAVKNNIA